MTPRKLPILPSGATLTEEADWLALVAKSLPATAYLAQLFSADLVTWVNQRLSDQEAPDLMALHRMVRHERDQARANAAGQAAAEARAAELEARAVRAEYDATAARDVAAAQLFDLSAAQQEAAMWRAANEELMRLIADVRSDLTARDLARSADATLLARQSVELEHAAAEVMRLKAVIYDLKHAAGELP